MNFYSRIVVKVQVLVMMLVFTTQNRAVYTDDFEDIGLFMDM